MPDPSSPRIRKSVADLTADDLDAFAVWEFALDEEGEEGQDESTVRPFVCEGELDPGDGMFVVRASFVLADGRRMQGYLTPPVQGQAGLATSQPVIVTDDGQVAFWCGTIAPTRRQLATAYETLGSRSAAVFPITFESAVPIAGGPIRGEIPGFIVLTDFQRGTTRVIT